MASSLIGSLRVHLGLDSAQFQSGLKRANGGMRRFGRMAKQGLIAVGAAAISAVGAMTVGVKKTLNFADEMAKSAQKIGIPVEELSKLKHAADLSGVSMSGLQTGIRRLSQNMNDAANGVGEGREAFEELGITVTNADGQLKSASQILAEMADKFAAMPDGAKKTALAMDLMGRSGADMIPMLNGGTDALKGMFAEAEALGIVITEDLGRNAEQFNDNMDRLGKVFQGLTVQLSAHLAPHLVAFTDWLVANGPAIVKFAGDFAAVTAAIGGFGAQVVQASESLGVFAEFLTTGVFAIVKYGERLKTFGEEIIEIFRALPGQMVQIGSDIIDGLWQGITGKWESVKEGVTNLAVGIADKFKSALDIFSPSRVMYDIGVDIMQGLANGMDRMAVTVESGATSVADTISGAFSNVGSSIAEAIQGTKSWKEVALDAIKSIANAILSNISFGGGFFGSIFNGLLGGLVGFASGGSFSVAGAGGIDSQVVAFKATPGERVSVSKPGQMSGNGSMYAPVYNIDARGADQAAIDRLERGLRERDEAFAGNVMRVTRQNQIRGARP